MPRSYGIDTSAGGPHECFPPFFTELGDQRRFRKTSEISQAFDSESLQTLDDQRIDRERIHRAAGEKRYKLAFLYDHGLT
jgi:hypothetical protein